MQSVHEAMEQDHQLSVHVTADDAFPSLCCHYCELSTSTYDERWSHAVLNKCPWQQVRCSSCGAVQLPLAACLPAQVSAVTPSQSNAWSHTHTHTHTHTQTRPQAEQGIPNPRHSCAQRQCRQVCVLLQMGTWTYFHFACQKSQPNLLARKGSKMQQLLEFYAQRQLLERAKVARS